MHREQWPRPPSRYSTFPRTEQPPSFLTDLVGVFRSHEDAISTVALQKGLTSDEVLQVLRGDLVEIGFEVEAGKRKNQKIERPVLFGENGLATVRYEVDAYQAEWRCGLEVEAGRGWMGNAVYRDLILASVMVDVDYLCLAVANGYRYKTGGRQAVSHDYDNATGLADTLFSHSRVKLPYRLCVIGY